MLAFHDFNGLKEMLITQFTFSIIRLNMSAQIPLDTDPRFVVIYSSSSGVPISFPLGSEEVAHVTSLRLSLKFQMSEEIMFIDEEVYDALSGDMIGTISQSPVCDGASKKWLLNAGRYRVYGVSDSVMAASTEQVKPHRPSSSPAQLTPATVVKLEQADELITILSEDSDGNSLVRVLSRVFPLVDRTLSKPSQKSPSSQSHLPPHIVC